MNDGKSTHLYLGCTDERGSRLGGRAATGYKLFLAAPLQVL